MSAETQWKVIVMKETAVIPIAELTVQAITSDDAREKAEHMEDVKHVLSVDWIDPEQS